MKSHRSHRVAAAAAMALTLTLTGCAQTGVDPSAAAVAGGRTISETEVQGVVGELNQLQLPQEIQPDMATHYLAIAPIVRNTFAESGMPIEEAQVRRNLVDPTATLSRPAMDILSTLEGIRMLTAALEAGSAPGAGPQQVRVAQRAAVVEQTVSKQIAEQMQNKQIQFNPKYIRGQENWIQQTAPEMPDQAPQG